jgi:molybdopterin-guanine dinucleotide biosynthesis protein A
MRPTFSVALLMGGRSRRMGVDKALLQDPSTGLASWERQAALLESLRPQHRIVSLRQAQDGPALGGSWRLVIDAVDDAGPISGISASLAALSDDLLVVLAVDLLAMTSDPLIYLLDHCLADRGAVYTQDGFYEPLAAVYPRCLAAQAEAFLLQGGRRLQSWVGDSVESGKMAAIPMPAVYAEAFTNVNDPADYAKLSSSHEC